MNSFFSDTKFSSENQKLYTETPESDLTRNVDPQAQMNIFNEMRKRQKKFIQPVSVSPDDQVLQQPLYITPLSIPTKPLKKKVRGTNSHSSISVLPSIYFSPIDESDDKLLKKKKVPSVFDSQHQQHQPALHSRTIFHSATSSSLIGGQDPFTSGKFEDRRDQERSSRNGFIKQKYENLMKNTFCLRNKHIAASATAFSSQLATLSTQNTSQTQYDNCPLGIFLNKKKDPSAPTATSQPDELTKKAKASQEQSQQRFDSIFKLMRLDQQQQQQDLSLSIAGVTSPTISHISKSTKSNSSTNPSSNVLFKSKKVQDDSNKLNLEVSGTNTFCDEYSRRLMAESLLNSSLLNQTRILERSKLPPVQLPSMNQQLPSLNPQFSNLAIQTVLNSSDIIDVASSEQMIVSSETLDEIALKVNPSQTQKQTSTTSRPGQPLTMRSAQFIQVNNQEQSHLESGRDTSSSGSKRIATTQDEQQTPVVEQSLPSGIRQRRQLHISAKSSGLLTKSALQKQFQLIADSDDEGTSSPLITLHNAISILNDQSSDNKQGDLASNYFSDDSEYGGDDDTNSQSSYYLNNPRLTHKTINQSKYKNFSKFGNDDDDDGDDEGSNYNSQDRDADQLHSVNSRSHRKPSISLIEQAQQLKKEPSIESNQIQGDNERKSPKAEGEEEGFVFKKKIDFDSLREIRNKTINRTNSFSSGPSSPLTPQTPSSNRPQVRLLVQSKLNRQDSLSNTPSKFRTTSNAFSSPSKESKTLIEPAASSPDKMTQINELATLDLTQNDSQVEANNQKNKTKGKNDISKVTSSLRQFFRKPEKKKPQKVVDNRNAEEVLRENDQYIATKLEEIKDKLRDGVKKVIKESIQKRVHNSLVSALQSKLANSSQSGSPSTNATSSTKPAATTATATNSTMSSSSNAQSDDSKSNSSNNKPRSHKFIRLPAGSHQDGSSNRLDRKNSIQTNDKFLSSLSKDQSMKSGMSNSTVQEQQKEVQEYSNAIMNFFDACVDNLKEKNVDFAHDFSLRNLTNFNEQMSENLKRTLEKELRKQNMSAQDVERFKYIYEINTKMHVFYQGMIRTLGGIDHVKDLILLVIKNLSTHITLFPINHVYSFEALHRRIIPSVCAILCDDHKLFLSTLRVFQQSAQSDKADFTFIDFFFIKKELFSLLTKKKNNEISTGLALSIMQKIESVRRYVFPLDVLSDIQIRTQIALNLSNSPSFMSFFNKQTFQLEQVANLVEYIFDYFYSDKEDSVVLDFNRIKAYFDTYLIKKMSRKVIDYIEVVTQQALQEDRFTRNVILRDLHYKFSKIRLRFGFNQGVFGVVKFEQTQQLIDHIKEDILRIKQEQSENGRPSQLQLKANDIEKAQDFHFLKFYLRFLFSEYDIFSVYDFSVAMPYYGVTLKIFKFWMGSLRNVLLTKYGIMPSKVNVFIRFAEACCPTT